MVRGLHIRIRGEELCRRITERLDVEETQVAALDARIKRRDGDQPFDIRVEDGLSRLAELKAEREQHSDRVRQLSLVRDSVIPDELYVLSRADLQLAGLIASETVDSRNDAQPPHAAPPPAVVDGLKVMVDGAELQDLLDRRIEFHRQRAAWWKHELARTTEDQTSKDPLPPDHLGENEAERHELRARVLQFVRDRLDPAETYRLGEVDLLFGDLLDERPKSLDRDDDVRRC
jgi:hypothetical protein